MPVISILVPLFIQLPAFATDQVKDYFFTPGGTCLHYQSGYIECKGDSRSGAFPATERKILPTWTKIEEVGALKKVKTGSFSACATTTDNQFLCWGDLPRTDRGKVEKVSPAQAYRLPDDYVVKDFEAENPICVLFTNGKVGCFGNIDKEFHETFFWIRSNFDNFTHIATGTYACGRTEVGDLLCWGHQIGSTPKKLDVGEKVVDVASGYQEVCALTVSGALKCFKGGNFKSYTTAFTDVKAVESSHYAICAHTSTKLHCWGANSKHEMESTDIVSFSTRCAQMKDGSTKCWSGKNQNAFDSKSIKVHLK